MYNDEYMKMLYTIDDWFQRDPIIIEWGNGLKIKCKSTSGIFENDAEPEDDDYVGEYSIGVSEIEIITDGTNSSIEAYIYEDSMEISLKNVPNKILSEDGTVLWESSVK